MAEPTYGLPVSDCGSGAPCTDGPHVCGTLVHNDHILFEPGKQQCESAVFTVADKPAIVTGFEFSDGACATIELVEGCNGGTYFAPLTNNCGAPASISKCHNRVVLDIPGRYRLVWKNCAIDEAFVSLRFATIPYAPAYATKPSGCCDPCMSTICGCGGLCSGVCDSNNLQSVGPV